MKILTNLFTPRVSVEEIHNAIDEAKFDLDNLLLEANIVTPTQLVTKAENMRKLGFSAINETVAQKEVFEQVEKRQNREILKNKENLALYNEYCVKYPKEKILHEDTFKAILDKYRLVCAPSSEYIKDVPEKIVNNLLICKDLQKEDEAESLFRITTWPFFYTTSNYYITQVKSLLDNLENHNIFFNKYGNIKSDADVFLILNKYGITPDGYAYGTVSSFEYFSIPRTGLQIAAPESHFNPNYFKMINQKVKSVITDDPIAFHYLKGGFIRILDKWGTEDDQSYLDPGLNNHLN